MMPRKYLLQSSLEVSAEASQAFMQEMLGITKQAAADDSNPHVFALHNMLLRTLGPEWVEWLPETLWASLHEEPSRGVKDKILALQLALKTNRPWVEYEVFEKLSTAFNGEVPHQSILEPQQPAECLLTVHVLHTLRADEKFSDEVYAYIAACFAHEGFLHVGSLPEMQPVQKFLDEMNHIYARIPTSESAHIGQLFSQLWDKHKGKADELMMKAEDDVVKVQLRKLYGIYTYLEENHGIQH